MDIPRLHVLPRSRDLESRLRYGPRALAALAARACAGLALLLAFGGCAAVKPWEREKLASPCMQSPFAKTALAGEYESKLTQTKTAGGLPGDAPGGGCGCVQ